MTSQYLQYQRQSVASLTAGEQLVLLYDQACLNIAKGINFIENKNICEAHNSIIKAENIFDYLIDSLDFNYPIASDLFSLYNYITDRLTQANLKKDANILREVQKYTCELRDTWKEAERISRSGVNQ